MKLISIFAFTLAVSGAAFAKNSKPVRVEFLTSLGKIEVEIDSVNAPKSSENFLWYVNNGHYNGGKFHRTVRADNQPNNPVKIDVIQGGRSNDEKIRPPVSLERTSVTKLKHVDGTLSMARSEPDTATSDFFVCIGNQPELDFGGKRNPDGQGFAAFGKVLKGMDIVKKIHQGTAEGQTLKPPISILSAKVIR